MPPRRVSEASPVQVYLGPEEQARLAELADRLKTTKSDVVRRGLLALERDLGEPDEHPALALIGLITGPDLDPDSPFDPARDHDRVLADAEEKRWEESRKIPPKKSGRTKRAR